MLRILVKCVNLIQVSLKSEKNNRPFCMADLRSFMLYRRLRVEYRNYSTAKQERQRKQLTIWKQYGALY